MSAIYVDDQWVDEYEYKAAVAHSAFAEIRLQELIQQRDEWQNKYLVAANQYLQLQLKYDELKFKIRSLLEEEGEE